MTFACDVYVDGEDDDGDGGHLRVLLAAAALYHRPRRPPARDLELRRHSAGVDRVSLAGGQQLLLEPDRLLLDQRHAAYGLHVRSGDVVSVHASTPRTA